MPIIYSVYDDGEHNFYTLNKKAATKHAQEYANMGNHDATVEANEIDRPSLALIVDILNRNGWASNVKTVATVRPNRNAAKDDEYSHG